MIMAFYIDSNPGRAYPLRLFRRASPAIWKQHENLYRNPRRYSARLVCR